MSASEASQRLFTMKAHHTVIDQRANLYNLETLQLSPAFVTTIREQARSVACLMDKSFLQQDEAQNIYKLSPRTPTFNEATTRIYSAPLGEDEAFRDEPGPGSSTAFLVGKRAMLTAAHCVLDKDSQTINYAFLKKVRVVFDFYMLQHDKWNKTFTEKQVYCGRLETLNLDCAKNPGFDDRKRVHIVNIEPFAIVESRGFSRTSKSKFQADRSISDINWTAQLCEQLLLARIS